MFFHYIPNVTVSLLMQKRSERQGADAIALRARLRDGKHRGAILNVIGLEDVAALCASEMCFSSFHSFQFSVFSYQLSVFGFLFTHHLSPIIRHHSPVNRRFDKLNELLIHHPSPFLSLCANRPSRSPLRDDRRKRRGRVRHPEADNSRFERNSLPH